MWVILQIHAADERPFPAKLKGIIKNTYILSDNYLYMFPEGAKTLQFVGG
jgi:hypothetical protein